MILSLSAFPRSMRGDFHNKQGRERRALGSFGDWLEKFGDLSEVHTERFL